VMLPSLHCASLLLKDRDNSYHFQSLAAHQARIPSVLITNFTFDSIYSLLSISFLEQSPSQHLLADPNDSTHHHDHPEPDTPIPEETLSPLVEQIFEGYRHADMLLVLPGAIPIPSFCVSPSLPATQWINPSSRLFEPEVVSHLIQDPRTYTLHPSIPFRPSHPDAPPVTKPKQRSTHLAPLLVRPPNDDVYTPEGRSRFLSSLGISEDLHDPTTTKILVVSFGGQVIHKPSRSRTPSRPASPNRPHVEHKDKLKSNSFTRELSQELNFLSRADGPGTPGQVFGLSHIYVPGAPAPAAMPSPTIPSFTTQPPTPILGEISHESVSAEQENADVRSLMLPDASWIAVVCGVADSREWQIRRRNPDTVGEISSEEDNDLPEGFYIAPRDVYIPDLMAVADVLLGKLVCFKPLHIACRLTAPLTPHRVTGVSPSVLIRAHPSYMVSEDNFRPRWSRIVRIFQFSVAAALRRGTRPASPTRARGRRREDVARCIRGRRVG
jgi:hypothetical protein